MTTEKICFRYDGSEEAKQGVFIKCLNKENISIGNFITSDGWIFINEPYGYRLVTPAEFIRLVSGEPQWTPKHGDEVEVSDDGENWFKVYYCCSNPNPDSQKMYPHIAIVQYGTPAMFRHIRPVRKSLREEIANILMTPFFTADQIIDIIKQRKDEL